MKLLPLLLLTLFLSPLTMVKAEGEAQTTPKVALSCLLNKLPSQTPRTFTLSKGETVELVCFLINTSKEAFSGTFLAKQTTSLNGEIAASAAAVQLAGEESKPISLSFAPVYVPGNYYYTAKFMGSEGQSFSQDILLTGVLEGEEVLNILTATLNKTEYAWSDSATLSLSLTANGQEDSFIKNEKPTLSIAMLTKEQTPCAYLLEKQEITGPKADYTFTFSDAELCSNAIKVTVQKENGEIMDQKIIAVTLPERAQKMTPSPVKTLLSLNQPMGILTWVGVLCLIFLAYFLWRHHKQA